MTKYVFTASEKQEIFAARLLCPAGDEIRDISSTGNWVPLYSKLSEIIGRHINAGDVTDAADLRDFKSAKLWLDVAIGANGGTGMHSAFIRSYTDRQGELRKGTPFSSSEMQKASNGVALNLYRNLSGLEPSTTAYEIWTIPTIAQIAEADASSIGRNLFAGYLSASDDAVRSNSAWSGTLGFNLLGGSSPFESWRLLADTTRADYNPQNTSASTVNSLDDFKNILYVVDSYQRALKAGYEQSATDFVNMLADQFTFNISQGTQGGTAPAAFVNGTRAQIAIQLSSGNYLGFIKDVAAKSPVISPVVNAISDIGINKFLDMLMGAVQGKQLLGTTTDTNFAANAKAFFGALTPEQLEILDAKLLPSSPSSIAALAQTDASVRAALVAGSIVKVRISDALANSEALSLVNPTTGQGSLSSQWITDRALFVTAIGTGKPDLNGQTFKSADLPTDRSFEFRYVDASGAQKIIFAENAARPGGVLNPPSPQVIVFGGAANDTLTGSESLKFGDHLYGGAGADTLDGNAGADYLEGGADNDTLNGGDNDRASDVLVGGVGSDTYQFTGAWGKDQIIDSDGLGQIKIDSDTVSDGKSVSNGVWLSTDNKYAFAKAELGGGKVDLIIARAGAAGSSASDNIITIKDFKSGDLGLTLEGFDTGGVTVTPQPTGKLDVFAGVPELRLVPVHQAIGVYLYANGIRDAAYDAYAIAGGAYVAAHANPSQIGGNDLDDVLNGGDGPNLITGMGGKDKINAGGGSDVVITGLNSEYTPPPSFFDQRYFTQYIHFWGVDLRNTRDPMDLGRADPATPYEGWIYTYRHSLHTYDPSPEVYHLRDGTRDISPDLYTAAGSTVDGGTGADVIVGGIGADYLYGGDGVFADKVLGGYGNDFINGGEGDDFLSGDDRLFDWTDGRLHGQDILLGGAGNDTLIGGGNSDVLEGGDGNDVLMGDVNIDDPLVLQKRNGQDITTAQRGDDYLDGGAGDDWLLGDSGADTLLGGAGNDMLFGDDLTLDNPVYTLAGTAHGKDYLDGGDGDDQLIGGGNNDILVGGAGDDRLFGDGEGLAVQYQGDDVLEGGDGSDTLNGGEGDDFITGDGRIFDDTDGSQHGQDFFVGGEGRDDEVHYQYRTGLRPYLLGCSPIGYFKTTNKVSPDIPASCRRTRSGKRFTTNSIAACARKQGARGLFNVEKRACISFKRQRVMFANSISAITDAGGAA